MADTHESGAGTALESPPALAALPLPPPAVPAPTPRPLWRNRDYVLLWSGQVVSTLGSSVSGIAVPLLILALTGSPEAAGIAGALGSIPYLLFSLPAGALVDRWDRKRVMLLCELGRALSLASVPVALALGVLTIWQLYINAFIEGTLFVFFNLAEVAALPQVVSKEQLPDATGQNQATFATAGLIGPALGGFLYQSIGRAVPFLGDALSYAISALSLFLIRTRFQEVRTGTAPRNLRAEIWEGLVWLWGQPMIRFMAFITGTFNFATAGFGLTLIVLARNYGASEAVIGLIFSVGAVGGLVGALLAGRLQRRFGFGPLVIASVWSAAFLYPLYVLAPSLLMLGLVSAGLFFTGPIYSVAMLSYRLPLIPDALQGRVNSVFRLVAFGFIPLGSALTGLLLEQIGAQATVLLFSLWMVGISLLLTLNREVRQARHATSG
jgi:MFS family permease